MRRYRVRLRAVSRHRVVSNRYARISIYTYFGFIVISLSLDERSGLFLRGKTCRASILISFYPRRLVNNIPHSLTVHSTKFEFSEPRAYISRFPLTDRTQSLVIHTKLDHNVRNQSLKTHAYTDTHTHT